jgi:hypothetical protein
MYIFLALHHLDIEYVLLGEQELYCVVFGFCFLFALTELSRQADGIIFFTTFTYYPILITILITFRFIIIINTTMITIRFHIKMFEKFKWFNFYNDDNDNAKN